MYIVSRIKKSLVEEKTAVHKGGRIAGAFLKRHPDYKKFVETFVGNNGHIFKGISEMLCWIVNPIKIKRCPVCNRHLSYSDSRDNRGFFCSETCKKSLDGKKKWAEYLRQKTMEKHGVANVFQLESTKQKIRQTNTERYGTDCALQNKNIKGKAKQTMLEKYGVENPYQNEEIKARMIEKKRETALKDTLKHLNQANLTIVDNFKSYNYSEQNKEYSILRCDICGNTFEYKFNHVKDLDNACPYCKETKASRGELEIGEFVKSLGLEFKSNDRTLINPLELDIVIPDCKVAIEYDGLYYHSESNKNKLYHLDKTNRCDKFGYRLVHIFEDEWINKESIVKSRLKSILGLVKNRIYARKCTVKHIDSEICNKFIDKYHIQGTVSASVKLGLYYKTRLVAVMTFGKPRFNKKYSWELLRYCTVANFNIVGGASKLLAAFRKEYGGTIITYADKRWSQGNMYKKLGFKELKDSAPAYYYWKSYNRYSRVKFQKHKLPNLLEKFDPNLSELENMLANGYRRIYDCGNKVFEL